eukprot:scaffold426695_cov20-Prasinocladus_malaysianus.AAC.1
MQHKTKGALTLSLQQLAPLNRQRPLHVFLDSQVHAIELLAALSLVGCRHATSSSANRLWFRPVRTCQDHTVLSSEVAQQAMIVTVVVSIQVSNQ